MNLKEAITTDTNQNHLISESMKSNHHLRNCKGVHQIQDINRIETVMTTKQRIKNNESLTNYERLRNHQGSRTRRLSVNCGPQDNIP